MTSIADQSVEELGGPSSVLVRMRREHEEQEALLQRLETTTGQVQDEVLTQLWRLVFTHAYAEEAVVWPAIRAVSADGEKLTLHIEQGHQKLSELTADLDRTRPGQPGREELITELVAELRLDIREEEDLLLPRLRQGADDRRLRRLGAAWTVVRHTAPTRPHVAVSRRPPGNVIAALPLSVLDRSRDRLDRAARGTGRVGSGAEAASWALTRVAGVIERSRLVQAGERARTRPGRWTVHRWLTRSTPPTGGQWG